MDRLECGYLLSKKVPRTIKHPSDLSLRSSQTMRCFLLAVFAACATQAFVLPSRPAAVVTRCSAVSVPAVSMNSLDKKKKAMNQKAKSSRSVTKRFKATATGKLLRRRPFRQHILTKKHPLRKQKLRKCATHPCPSRPGPQHCHILNVHVTPAHRTHT